MEPREIKGLEIAAKSKVIRKGKSNLWLVPSQAGREEKYTVAMHDEKPECTCRDFEFRATKCKHIFAVEYTLQHEFAKPLCRYAHRFPQFPFISSP